jgi:hypothetical protein
MLVGSGVGNSVSYPRRRTTARRRSVNMQLSQRGESFPPNSPAESAPPVQQCSTELKQLTIDWNPA